MTTNPFLKKLGFSDNDRAVIIHTDDIGMCHASVQAFKDLWAFGTISSGATMVPCPWFPAVAQMCRENPDMDMGVHDVERGMGKLSMGTCVHKRYKYWLDR